MSILCLLHSKHLKYMEYVNILYAGMGTVILTYYTTQHRIDAIYTR